MTDLNAHNPTEAEPKQPIVCGTSNESVLALSLRRTLAVVVSLLPALGLAIVALALGPRLGATMATHWSATGPADSFGPTWPTFAGFAIPTAVSTVAGVWVLLRRKQGRAERQWSVFAVLLSGIFAVAWVVAAWATVDASPIETAELGARMLLLLVAPVLAGAVFLLVPVNALPESDKRSIAAASLRDEERLAWVGASGSVPFAIIAAVIGVGGIVVLAVLIANGEPAGALIGAIVGIAAGLSAMLLARVRLTVDERGVRLTSAFLGLPLMRIPLSDIEEISVETIDPMLWGGWGFRFSPGRRAYVTGLAPGIVVSRRGGSQAAVTIQRAEEAAAVGQALLERSSRVRT
jgi:hypothetical protein